MKIIVKQEPESVLCTFSNGDQLEVTMLSVENDGCFVEPSIEGTLVISNIYFNPKRGFNSPCLVTQ